MYKPSEGRLSGKRAIVAGGANGIGGAIAACFAGEGGRVAVIDVDRIGAESLASEIIAAGGEAIACAADVSDSHATKGAVDEAIECFEGLDIVVSGAAIFTPSAPLHLLEEADWQRALAVNLSGAYHVCKHALPALQLAGGGSVILIASQMARVANPGQAAYCATKGALVQLAKAMALDYAPDNIRVNTLSPGAVVTRRILERHGDVETA